MWISASSTRGLRSIHRLDTIAADGGALLGRLSPDHAIQSRAVRLEGSRALVRSFGAWYPRSYEFEGEPARQAEAMLKDATSASRAATRRGRSRTAQPS